MYGSRAVPYPYLPLPQELESTLCSHVKEEGSKREMLYHKWSERVFSPLHTRLASVHGSSHYRNMDTERRALFQRYLDYRNHKVHNTSTLMRSKVTSLPPT